MKPVRTTTVGVIFFVTIGLAGCSSSSSGAAAPAPTTLAGSPTAPRSSAPASPATPVAPVASSSGPADVTPITPPPSVAPPPPVAPTSAAPPVGAHAVTAFGGVPCPAPQVNGAGSATRLPAAVHIKAVVRCETVARNYPGLGTWTVQLAEVADANLGPFLAALGAPSLTRRTDVICPDLVILVPWFGVVDDAGKVTRPSLPTDACGKPQTAVIAALQALQFRVTQAVRVAPVG